MAKQLLRQHFIKIMTRCSCIQNKPSADTSHYSQPYQIVSMSTWEKDRKAGYGKPRGVSKIAAIEDYAKGLGSEMGMWQNEVKQKFTVDPKTLNIQHGDAEYVWQFHDQKSIENWTVTADRDNNEGNSQAEFIFSKNKTGLFHGQLSRKVPKDGVIKRSGYCNIRSPTKCLSFKKEDVHDWTSYTHLLMRIRGDGRSYMLIVDMERFFDVCWHDQYHYVLFTRGGPYWQTAKIPFSKFYATSKGRIQDQQSPIQLDKVTHLGISVADDNEGLFQLEIDFIAVVYDENHEEVFAYD